LLVEQAIKFVKPIKSKVKSPINVVDVGTGSGAIIIALAKTLKYDNIRYYASDISKKALKVARENARLNGIDGNIKFFQSDLLANFKLPKKIDILIANLPYVPFSFCHSEASFCHSEAEPKNLKILRSAQDDIEKSIRNSKTLSFEPQNALFAAKGGLELIEKLIIQISKLSYKPQLIILEVFETHPHLIKQIAKKYLPMYSLEAKKDYAGLNRLVILSVLP
jgi:release factor glutamine methyltransferase